MRKPYLWTLISTFVLVSSFGPAHGQLSSGDKTPLGEPEPRVQEAMGETTYDFNLSGLGGAATILNPETGEMEIFNTLSIQPELAIWKLGIGLDLYVYFDSDGKVRKEDWDTSEDIISKIWYLRWGKKGEPVYARVGGLTNTTIGHGFIMGGYSNRLRYPDVRQVGALLDIDGGWAGIEGVVTDLRRATLHGGRFFVRPLHGAEVPLVKNLGFGVSGITDRDPDGDKGTRNDQVSVYGVDLDLPVAKSSLFSATLYADAAMMRLGGRYKANGVKDNGRGYMTGVGGRVLFFDYRAEFRSIDKNFVPTFFDGYYEIDRSTAGMYKADAVATTSNPKRRGPFIELYADILQKVWIGGSYEDLNVDPFGIYPRLRGEVRIDPSLFLGKLRAAVRYEQRNVDKWKYLGRSRTPDTIITSELGYIPNEHLTILVVWKQTFDDLGQPVRTTQFRTDVRF